MAIQQRPVHVVGVGMIPFTKPGASESYNTMGARAAQLALDDAGVPYDAVQQAYVGYVYGDSTAGQAAIYGVGLSGIPIFNVNNNCSTGSSALYLARQAVASGVVECGVVLGPELHSVSHVDCKGGKEGPGKELEQAGAQASRRSSRAAAGAVAVRGRRCPRSEW